MNEVRTYRSEEEDNNSIQKKSKKVKCPNCNEIGYTIVEEKCDDCWGVLFFIFCCPLFCICQFLGQSPGKKLVHYCRYCKHDCTDVEPYNECPCILF